MGAKRLRGQTAKREEGVDAKRDNNIDRAYATCMALTGGCER